jgi:glycosyltransferase involved in cell wall biosynthesis
MLLSTNVRTDHEALEDIRISVALVTRNGPDRLKRCLQSLRGHNIHPFEIIVSDDSDQEFAARTRTIALRYGCRYIEGPHRGLYANRNHAAAACQGTHIRTMDDDHTFPAGHFELCFQAVRSDPEAIWTTGEIGFVDGKYSNRVETAGQLNPNGVGSPPEDLTDNWAISDGSTIYPASVFHKGYRMVEKYGYGSSYLEFGALLYHNGYHSRCIKGAVVEHYGTNYTIRRMTTYDRDGTASLVFAMLSYNLFFKRNILKASFYLAKLFWRSHFDLLLLAQLPRIVQAVCKRWLKPSERYAL